MNPDREVVELRKQCTFIYNEIEEVKNDYRMTRGGEDEESNSRNTDNRS
jgi:hypothetical protein